MDFLDLSTSPSVTFVDVQVRDTSSEEHPTYFLGLSECPQQAIISPLRAHLGWPRPGTINCFRIERWATSHLPQVQAGQRIP